MTDLMDAVAAATAGVSRLYPVNGAPDGPTYPYGVYSAVLGGGDSYTLDETYGVRTGLVVFQTFGRTADSALTRMEDVIGALLDRRLTLPGYDCTPLKASLDEPAVVRDPDDTGVVAATLPFRFTATKEA